jgi:hypothetical protein
MSGLKVLNKFYAEFTDKRIDYLNSGIFWKFFFGKSVPVETNLEEIIDFLENDTTSYFPHFSHEIVVSLDTKMVEWTIAQATYAAVYDKCQTKNYDLQQFPNFSIKNETDIIVRQILDKYKLAYVTNHNFYSKSDNKSKWQKPLFNFEYSLKVDIYGHFVFKRRQIINGDPEMLLELNPFAIIYSNGQTDIKTKLNLLLKAYFLKQLNIHVLITDSKSKAQTNTIKFLKAIKHNRQHICHNLPIIDFDLDNNTNLGILLDKFKDAYAQGRISLYKFREDEILIEDVEVDLPIAEAPLDEGYAVDSDLLNKLKRTHRY